MSCSMLNLPGNYASASKRLTKQRLVEVSASGTVVEVSANVSHETHGRHASNGTYITHGTMLVGAQDEARLHRMGDGSLQLVHLH